MLPLKSKISDGSPFPFSTEDSADAATGARASHRRLTPFMGVPTGRSRRVLVVDDNEDAVESLADLSRPNGPVIADQVQPRET